MDGGNHFSSETALMAMAAPAAPIAMPSPEIVVVVVLVPSGAVVSTIVQAGSAMIVAATTNGQLCFNFMVFFCFLGCAFVQFLDALIFQFQLVEKVFNCFAEYVNRGQRKAPSC